MLEIKAYIKRERPVEAIRFEGGRKSASELATWAESFSDTRVKYMGIQDFLMVDSGDNWGATIHKGQWLVRTHDGFVSHDDEDFHNKYAEAPVGYYQ